MTANRKSSKAKNEKHGEWHLNTSWHVDDTTYERIENNSDESEDVMD
jgi:hypothetical protein